MNKAFIRGIAILLIPCLVGDPLTASAFAVPSPFVSASSPHRVFTEQAVVPHILSVLHLKPFTQKVRTTLARLRPLELLTSEEGSLTIPPPASGEPPKTAFMQRHNPAKPLLPREERIALFKELNQERRILEVLLAQPDGDPIHYTFLNEQAQLTSNMYYVHIRANGGKFTEPRTGQILGVPDSPLRFQVERYDRGRRMAVLKRLNGPEGTLPKEGRLKTVGANASTRLELAAVIQAVESLEKSDFRTTGSENFDRLFGLVHLTPSDPSAESSIQFIDTKIAGDPSERALVELAMNPTEILFAEGPAGTAKTTVILEVLRQRVKRGERGYLVSQMHQGVDNAVAQLIDDENVPVLRLGNNPGAFKYGTIQLWPGNREKKNEDTEVSTGLRPEVIEAFQSKSARIGGGGVWATTDISVVTDFASQQSELAGFMKDGADFIIMDEASREGLGGALVALSRLKPGGKIIFIGDIHQLPPFPFSHEAKIEMRQAGIPDTAIQLAQMSFFERLLEPSRGDRVELRTNYRSPPLLVQLLSELFYGGLLQAFRADPLTLDTVHMSDIGLRSNGRGPYFDIPFGTSHLNRRSALEDLERVRYYHHHLEIPLHEITVVTPYSAQVELLERLLEKEFSGSSTRPLVTTIDSYQGGQNRAVILDLVRSNPEGNIGFTDDPHQLLVALSRSTEFLSVVWDTRTYLQDRLDDSESTRQARDLFKKLKEFHARHVLTVFPNQREEATLRYQRAKTESPSLPPPKTDLEPKNGHPKRPDWQIKMPGENDLFIQVTEDFAQHVRGRSPEAESVARLIEMIPSSLKQNGESISIQSVEHKDLVLFFVYTASDRVITVLDYAPLKEKKARLHKLQPMLSALNKFILDSKDSVANLFSRIQLTSVEVGEGSLPEIILNANDLIGFFKQLIFHPLEKPSLSDITHVIPGNFGSFPFGQGGWMFNLVWKELIEKFEEAGWDETRFHEALVSGARLTETQLRTIKAFTLSWHVHWKHAEQHIIQLIKQEFDKLRPAYKELAPLYAGAIKIQSGRIAKTIENEFLNLARRNLRGLAEDDALREDAMLRELAYSEIRDAHEVIQKIAPAKHPFLPRLEWALGQIERGIQRRQDLAAEKQRRREVEEAARQARELEEGLAREAAEALKKKQQETFPPERDWVLEGLCNTLVGFDIDPDPIAEGTWAQLDAQLNRPGLTEQDQIRILKATPGFPEEVYQQADNIAPTLAGISYARILPLQLLGKQKHRRVLQNEGSLASMNVVSRHYLRLITDEDLHQIATILHRIGLYPFAQYAIQYERVQASAKKGSPYIEITSGHITLPETSLRSVHLVIPDLENTPSFIKKVIEDNATHLSFQQYIDLLDSALLHGLITYDQSVALKKLLTPWLELPPPITRTSQLGGYMKFYLMTLLAEALWVILVECSEDPDRRSDTIDSFLSEWRAAHADIQDKVSLRTALASFSTRSSKPLSEMIAKNSFAERLAHYALESLDLSFWPEETVILDPLTEEERSQIHSILEYISRHGHKMLIVKSPPAKTSSTQLPPTANIITPDFVPGSWPDKLLTTIRLYSSLQTQRDLSAIQAVAERQRTTPNEPNVFEEGRRRLAPLLQRIPRNVPMYVLLPDGDPLIHFPRHLLEDPGFERVILLTPDVDHVHRTLRTLPSKWNSLPGLEVLYFDVSRVLLTSSFLLQLIEIPFTASSLQDAHSRLRKAYLEEVEASENHVATSIAFPKWLAERERGFFVSLRIIPDAIDAVGGAVTNELAARFGSLPLKRPAPPLWFEGLLGKGDQPTFYHRLLKVLYDRHIHVVRGLAHPKAYPSYIEGGTSTLLKDLIGVFFIALLLPAVATAQTVVSGPSGLSSEIGLLLLPLTALWLKNWVFSSRWRNHSINRRISARLLGSA
jgi:hypothetical protein